APSPAPSPSPSPAPSSVSALACAVIHFRLRLSSLLASSPCSPRLPVPFFLPPVSYLPPSRLPSSPASLPCLRPPAVSRLPSRLRLRLPFFPFSLALRLCFFLVGEAAVDIQLRRSLLSGSNSGAPCCRDPTPALPAPDRCNRNGLYSHRVCVRNPDPCSLFV
ncbi:hypothetical protein ACLOJK_009923, partial [Asimina triloba]